MCVCVYVCMYVCMYVCILASTTSLYDTVPRPYVCVCVYVCMYVCMYSCMYDLYVCMYVNIHQFSESYTPIHSGLVVLYSYISFCELDRRVQLAVVDSYCQLVHCCEYVHMCIYVCVYVHMYVSCIGAYSLQ